MKLCSSAGREEKPANITLFFSNNKSKVLVFQAHINVKPCRETKTEYCQLRALKIIKEKAPRFSNFFLIFVLQKGLHINMQLVRESRLNQARQEHGWFCPLFYGYSEEQSV